MSILPMKKIIILCFLVAGISTQGYSQTKKAYIKAAEEAYATKNYYGALSWYGEALEFDSEDTDVIFNYAEAARGFEAYDLAAEKYKLLVDSISIDKYPQASFYLGEMYQRLGKYKEAKQFFSLYTSEYSDIDSIKTIKANHALESLDFAIEKVENIDKSAEVTQMESAVNTPYSEFGAIKRDSILYFTTMRYAENDPEEVPARSLSKLHTLENDENALIDANINETEQLVAHTAFSHDGKTLYYNLCDYINDEDVRCALYKRQINEDGTFGEMTKLPSPINIDSTTTTQPHITYDAEVDMEILFFVSDRAGGAGMLDIYYSLIFPDGSFSDPQNFEEINTTGNDVTPFAHMPSNTVYFSSDARMGLGGYDIFKTVKTEEESWGEPTILSVPVNSSYHDLYYTLDDVGDEGYFSSNREGAMYIDPAQKACCFDIYNVTYDEVILELEALTFDAFTKDSLAGATLFLVNAETNDTIKMETNEAGYYFYFKLKKGKEYRLIATRDYYNPETTAVSTMGITSSKIIKKDIFLTTDRMQLKVLTFNNKTKEELEGVQITIKNLTTNKIDTIAINEIGNDYYFYLETGNKYEIEALKFGFVTKSEMLDLTNATPGLIEKKMYLDVFELQDYMPLAIYFAHDQPEPKSNKTTTNKTYTYLFNEYMSNKFDYIKHHTKRLKEPKKSEAVNNLDTFFEGDVAGGFDMFKRFMRSLKKELSLGRSLEIAIKGYASPIADKRYNLALGQRRVASVKNEILNYEGGIFREYVNNGKLILTDISFGEETAPTDVSDKLSDIKNSIYGVRAGIERRVQIIRVTDF